MIQCFMILRVRKSKMKRMQSLYKLILWMAGYLFSITNKYVNRNDIHAISLNDTFFSIEYDLKCY